MSNKPKTKCHSVKNPCKYCLTQVTHRNGLQCQGACKKWAHYKCLHYTPGKISDIKAGIIKVMCPCPDCETNQEKEYLTNPPYTCSNQKCPGNLKGPIKCDSDECPSNRNKVLRQDHKCSTKLCVDDALGGPTQTRCPPPRKSYPARLPSPQCSPIPKTYKSPCCGSRSRMPRKQKVETACTSSNSSCDRASRSFSCCWRCSCLPIYQVSGLNQNAVDYGKEGNEIEQDLMVNALHEMSGTVGMLSKQIRELMCKINKMVDNEGSEPKYNDR